MSETKKCKECQTDIPKKAKRCPSCTADQRSWIVRNPIKTILLIFIGLPILFTMIASSSSNTKTNSSEDQLGANSSTPVWKYTTETDEFSDSKQEFARLFSTNELNFDFPYNGGSRFQLIVRNLNKGKGEEVLITVTQGQFQTYDENIKVRFDNGEPITYSISGASDGDSEVIFIKKSSSFISNLKNSSSIKVEAPFYDAGRQVIYFDTENYKDINK